MFILCDKCEMCTDVINSWSAYVKSATHSVSVKSYVHTFGCVKTLTGTLRYLCYYKIVYLSSL